MTDLETRLAEHLRAAASKAVPHPDLDAATSAGNIVRLASGQRRRRLPRIAAAAAVVALVGAGGVALTLRNDDPATGDQPVNPIAWSTPQVRLSADDFAITIDDNQFMADDVDVEVSSDPGDAAYTTLELTWMEHDVEMRWYIYFQSDGDQWWSDEMRTYNGQTDAEWITFHGDYFRAQLGHPFRGDLDVTATEEGFTSRLQLGGLELQAFLDPPRLNADPALSTTTNPDTTNSLPSTPINWTTPHVRLSAENFGVTIDGEQFTGEGASVESELITPNYVVLVATWQVGGRDAQWELYLYSDEETWGSNEMAVSRGSHRDGGERLLFKGSFLRGPAGQVLRGDFDEIATPRSSDIDYSGRVEATGLEVQLLSE